MKKIILMLSLFCFSMLYAEYHATISKITPGTKTRMIEGKSWHKGCPVPLKDLRYIRLKHHNFYRGEKMGELIVHKDVANEVVEIFKALYDKGYPIRKMQLISDFKGSDWRSIEADNTSAFNCRKTSTKTGKWSKHAYGKAIDINPIENPFVFKNGRTAHTRSYPYKKRVHKSSAWTDKAILLKEDETVKIFEKYGWKWGGEFSPYKDYQHFSK
ncbi:M15 family metallopeptidase [Sulfurovum sp.]|uniref:M15 family metallopeptidase n=1 Tax=Sulfurovum sp. TaxID=1969726 RepID=UPI0025DA49BD|nr:M15 family metallopeptidase [Sulfurovum sp.]